MRLLRRLLLRRNAYSAGTLERASSRMDAGRGPFIGECAPHAFAHLLALPPVLGTSTELRWLVSTAQRTDSHGIRPGTRALAWPRSGGSRSRCAAWRAGRCPSSTQNYSTAPLRSPEWRLVPRGASGRFSLSLSRIHAIHAVSVVPAASTRAAHSAGSSSGTVVLMRVRLASRSRRSMAAL
jgi:hypothetical protein